MMPDEIINFVISSPNGNFFFKVNYGNTGTMREICSKLAIETPERRYWRHSSVFIFNFKQVNVGWDVTTILSKCSLNLL